MDLAPSKTKHMLIFRGTEWHKGLSPAEMQKVSSDWMAWFTGLMNTGKAIAGNPLERASRVVSGPNGRMVADGPFAEAKETIGGYFLLEVDTMDEAVAIAQQCPGLKYGAVIEVRPVADACRLAEESAAADDEKETVLA